VIEFLDLVIAALVVVLLGDNVLALGLGLAEMILQTFDRASL